MAINRPWADQPTSLNLAEVQKTVPDGANPTFADIAGYTLGQVDKVLAQVGKPVGIKTYTPYHATGEEFLHDYLGMIGLPMDILPHFPTNADMVLLTEQAKFDPDIIAENQSPARSGQVGLRHLRLPARHEEAKALKTSANSNTPAPPCP